MMDLLSLREAEPCPGSAREHGHHTAAVVGLGLTGLSCARFLQRRGVSFVGNDTRARPPGLDCWRRDFPEAPVYVGGLRVELLKQAGYLLLSPGLSPNEAALVEAAAAGVPLLGDIELFRRHSRAPVVAVTGTNGKTTTVHLLRHLMQASGWRVGLGGNSGPPALDVLDENVDLYVLELSSFQLERVERMGAAAAVVLNVSPDHLERYRNLRHYAGVKRRIYRGAEVRVVNLDDALAHGCRCSGDILSYSRRAVRAAYGLVQRSGRDWLMRRGKALLPVEELCLRGPHNWSNALAALCLGEAVGLDIPEVVESLRDFRGLPHRLQRVGERRGVAWYNDSKATNVKAARVALETLGERAPLLLICGGLAKHDDYGRLAEAARGRVRLALCLGRDAALLEAQLAPHTDTRSCATMAEAVRIAAACARAGDTVLLAPACSSRDSYRDFEERGEDFMKQVLALPEFAPC